MPFCAPCRNAKGEITGVIANVHDVTDRVHADSHLRESEERYRTQFRLASEGIITHTFEGVLLEVNDAFASMHGYTPEEMLSLRLEDLDLSGSFKMVNERLTRIMAGEALTFEVEHTHKDGHVFPLEVSASLIATAAGPIILSFHRDITQRKRAEEALVEAKALTEAIVESTPDMIWSVDSEGFRLTTFNHGLSDYFLQKRGLRLQVGMGQEDLFPPGALGIAGTRCSGPWPKAPFPKTTRSRPAASS